MQPLRICICLLGIVLLLAMGKLGEEGLGTALVLLDKAGLRPEDLNGLTAFVIQNYRLNQDHFLLSLTPFLCILATMPFLDRLVMQWDARFWYAFACVWFSFMIYFCLFTYALLYPFTHIGLAAEHEATIVTWAAVALSIIVIAAVIGLYVRAPRLKGTAELPAAADTAKRRG